MNALERLRVLTDIENECEHGKCPLDEADCGCWTPGRIRALLAQQPLGHVDPLDAMAAGDLSLGTNVKRPPGPIGEPVGPPPMRGDFSFLTPARGARKKAGQTFRPLPNRRKVPDLVAALERLKAKGKQMDSSTETKKDDGMGQPGWTPNPETAAQLAVMHGWYMDDGRRTLGSVAREFETTEDDIRKRFEGAGLEIKPEQPLRGAAKDRKRKPTPKQRARGQRTREASGARAAAVVEDGRELDILSRQMWELDLEIERLKRAREALRQIKAGEDTARVVS